MNDKIKDFCENQKYTRITRQVAEKAKEFSNGYIVDYSDNFIVMQMTDDFELFGFEIYPIQSIKNIRNNKHEKYYDKIMVWENEKENLGVKTKVDLSTWTSIMKTFQKKKKNIIIECENPKISSFNIGPIERITVKSVYIRYFDAAGFFNEKLTKINFEDITKIMFDDRYIDIFSKYTRKRKKSLK